MPDAAQRPSRSDDHRDHPEGVGERVSDDRVGRCAVRDVGRELFERRRQGRSIRLGPGEQSGTSTRIESEQFTHTGNSEADRGEQHDDADAHPETILAESTEECWARRQPDGVDEQRQSEERDDRGKCSQFRLDRRERKPSEKCSGRAEADSADADSAECCAESDDHEQHEERIGRQHSHGSGSTTNTLARALPATSGRPRVVLIE